MLYHDETCVVVNKLCGEAVEGAGKGMGDLPRMIGEALANKENAVFQNGLSLPVAVHRLDVPVTGCALFALTQEALVFLNTAFAKNENGVQSVEKHYWAVIEKPQKQIPLTASLTHWVLFDAKKNKSYAFDEPGPGRKKALLEYQVIGEGQNYLFVDVKLITGRHHQIRCQFEKIGLHIKGDLKYSARRSEPQGGIRLHARSLAFPNPSGGDRICVTAEPPILDALWQAFTSLLTSSKNGL